MEECFVPMNRLLLISTATVALAYVAMCVLLFIWQRRLLYLPASTPPDEQLNYARGAGLTPWVDAAGTRIGWKRETHGAGEAQRWVVFHGNAGLAVQRAHWADALERVSTGRAVAVYILEYPGYSGRAGKPSEPAIVTAALAAIDALPQDGTPVYLLGESLGCAVAVRVAAAQPSRIGGMVLVTPFNCLADVAQYHYPWFPVRWLLRDQWRSDENLRGFPGPVAILAAENDQVAPARLAQKLHDGYPGRKWLHVVAGEAHGLFVFDQPWFKDAVAFATGGTMSPDK